MPTIIETILVDGEDVDKAALRDYLADFELGNMDGIFNTLRVGASAGAGTRSPVEFVDEDCGLALTATKNTTTFPATESYVAGFLKDAAGNYVKVGVMAVKWADNNVTNGYGSWNVHTTAYTAGVTADYMDLVIWAKHGAAFFTNSDAAAAAPGPNVLLVRGSAGATGATARSETTLWIEKQGDTAIQFLTEPTDTAYIFFGDTAANNVGWISYSHVTDELVLRANAANRLTIKSGLQIGAPTGGDKGGGTANFAGDIYKNDTAFTNPDFVLEHWATGRIERFVDKEGAADYAGLVDLADVESYARENLHLPRFGQHAKHGIFSGSDALLASVEEAYLYLFDMNHRLQKLEAAAA